MFRLIELWYQMGSLQAPFELSVYMLVLAAYKQELAVNKQQRVAVHMYPLEHSQHKPEQGYMSAPQQQARHNETTLYVLQLVLEHKLDHNCGHFRNHGRYRNGFAHLQ